MVVTVKEGVALEGTWVWPKKAAWEIPCGDGNVLLLDCQCSYPACNIVL